MALLRSTTNNYDLGKSLDVTFTNDLAMPSGAIERRVQARAVLLTSDLAASWCNQSITFVISQLKSERQRTCGAKDSLVVA